MIRNSLILFFLCCIGLPVAAKDLLPFEATYVADMKDVPLGGTAQFTLKKNSNHDWVMDFKAALILVSLEESSQFRMKDGKIQPINYHFKRQNGFGKTKAVKLEFDWVNKLVKGEAKGDPVSLPITPDVYDKATYQIALQRDLAAGQQQMTYQVVDDDEMDSYVFKVVGDETIQTPLGNLKTTKVERIRAKDNKRQTLMWFAQEHQFILVKLFQREKDGKEYQIILQQASIDNKPLDSKLNGK